MNVGWFEMLLVPRCSAQTVLIKGVHRLFGEACEAN